MAPLTPTPGLYAAVLEMLRSADPWSAPLASVLSPLAEHLTSDEAAALPQAIAHVLPLLRGDRERLRFAAEAATRLDYFETAATVADLAVELDDRDLLLEAAALCGNPAVASGIRERVARAVGDDRPGRIRMDSKMTPRTALEKRLYFQCWPGATDFEHSGGVAPTVVLDTRHDPLAVLRLSVRLDQAGAALRRLAADVTIPLWLGSRTVVVCLPSTRTRVLGAYPKFPERQIITDEDWAEPRRLDTLMRQIKAALDGSLELPRSRLAGQLDEPVWQPEVFTAGVYPTKDAAFLTGVSASSMYSLRKRGVVSPRELSGICWNFREVVAMRTWKFMSKQSGHPISGNVLPALVRFAGDADAIRIGVTSEGDVLAQHGEEWVNVDSGQATLPLDITDFDDVFRPFDYGGGTVPDLLRASTNTRLHPTVLSGTPHLDGHRISAKALARVDAQYRPEAIELAYPELRDIAYHDTLAVGLRMLGLD